MYQRKTTNEFVVQTKTRYGWEDATTEETLKEAKIGLREYIDNEPGYIHRLIKRRVKIEEV